MRKKILHIGLMGIALGLLGLLLIGPKPAMAANPTTINFQGKVVNANGTNVADGTYSFVFRIYNTASPTPTTACGSDSACLFEETQGSVSVTSGTFQVELGSTCSGGLVGSNACTKSVAGGLNFASNSSLYLTLQFSGDTSGTHGGFMWPVIHLTSVPYAYYADNAGALNGLSSGNFVQLAQSLQTDSTSNESIAIKKTGSANILDLQNSSATLLIFANTGALTVTPSGNNIGTTFKQTSGTATSGDVFDIQTATGGLNFIQITNAAANEGNVTVQSVGATRSLTLNSSNGTLALGSATTTLQKSGAAFTIDVSNGASNSELDISNSGGAGNVTLKLDTGGVFAVGAATGSTISACGSNNYVSSFASTGGIITGGSCGTIASTQLSDTANIAYVNAGNTFAPTANLAGTVIRQTTGTTTSGNVFDVQGANTTSHFIQVTETAANQGSISLTSLGSNGLTLQSGSGTVTLGSSTILTATAGLQVTSGSGNLTLNAAGGTIALGTNTTAVLFSNSGAAAIDATSGQELDLGINGTAHLTKVGATATSSTSTIQSGTGGINLLPDGGTNTGAVVKPTNNSTKAFQVQTAGGNAVLGVATSTTEASNFVSLGLASNINGRLLFNNSAGTNNITLQAQAVNPTSSFALSLPSALPGASNYCIVSSNLGVLSFLPCGAGSTATVTLAPEFVGAVMSGVGGVNTGTMTSDYCAGSSKFPSGINTGVCTVSTDEHNYYSWTANATNNYDIFVRWSVPQDFASFSSGSFNYWKTAAGDTVTMNVYPGSSTACATQAASGATAAWGSQAITMTGCTPSAGGVMTIDIHLAVGTNGNFARIGEITLGYSRN